MALERIEFKRQFQKTEQGEPCPSCNVPTVLLQIPCPDGQPGCCVLHRGFVCPQCREAYNQVLGLLGTTAPGHL
jgi:hypothetical protein